MIEHDTSGLTHRSAARRASGAPVERGDPETGVVDMDNTFRSGRRLRPTWGGASDLATRAGFCRPRHDGFCLASSDSCRSGGRCWI